jgi:hypothetical protein
MLGVVTALARPPVESGRTHGAVGVDVLGATQFGPSVELDVTVHRMVTVGLTGRYAQAGVLAHYIPDLYSGEGKLRPSFSVGTNVRIYPRGGRYRSQAGGFVGPIVEYFFYDFEHGHRKGTSVPDRQTVHMLILGAEGGYRWDFRRPWFISLYGAVAVPVVLAYRKEAIGIGVETEDRKDADAVPPVAMRLSLAFGAFF